MLSAAISSRAAGAGCWRHGRDVILAVIVFIRALMVGVVALGLLLGINMVFGGWAMIAMAWHARSA